MVPRDPGASTTVTRRLTLVIHSLAQGGAERDMAHLARCWAERGDDVAVVTLDSVDSDSYPLADSVTRPPAPPARPRRPRGPPSLVGAGGWQGAPFGPGW